MVHVNLESGMYFSKGARKSGKWNVFLFEGELGEPETVLLMLFTTEPVEQ
ncbi:hypothetical protein ACQ0QQ_13760 [Lysinibacillus sphaericus]